MGQGCSAIFPYRSVLQPARPLLPFHSNKAFILIHVRRMGLLECTDRGQLPERGQERQSPPVPRSVASGQHLSSFFSLSRSSSLLSVSFPPAPLCNLHFLTRTLLFPQTTFTNQHDSQSRYQRVSALSLRVTRITVSHELVGAFCGSITTSYLPTLSVLSPCHYDPFPLMTGMISFD